MAKHRHHHHHSKSPSRRPPSADGRPLFQENNNDRTNGLIASSSSGANRKSDNTIARHRHRSTPPRAEISRRRPIEEQEHGLTNVGLPHPLDSYPALHQYATPLPMADVIRHHRDFGGKDFEGLKPTPKYQA
eukprot:Protomagalhaensia_sp_Gyna_25__1339@NODE_1673_length_1635_cov_95_115288_g1370_i0_p2_GENE_NODE_1673_length_1635_cov_95_115288_g1370_i0NODE_1673_length_1635_cov_95_115288_g1370_i0_p2_ORF_typecomplete_len132_score3_25_NODE_1673_length_1635_cov_95_115288_g1370_i0389784